MLKSGPKKRFPIRNEAAEGVADDMALRSDCSSSVGAVKAQDNHKLSSHFSNLNSPGLGSGCGFLR